MNIEATSGPLGIRLAVARPDDLDEMIALLALTFAANDPPAIALGLTAADFSSALEAGAPSIAQGLSVVARDAATGRLAGAVTAEDAATPEPVGDIKLSPKFGPMIELLAQLEPPGHQPPPPGTLVHILFLGVGDEVAGRGVAQALVRACVANAAARGFARAHTEASNKVSQRIFAKLGFTVEAAASYAGFRRDGTAPFASIADVGGPMRMVRDLHPGEPGSS
jgi:ribosomal protein S18 acetylase RimI-like enzyme